MTQEWEDWDALVKSPGWLRLIAFIKTQWGSAAYQQKIEKAITDAEEKRQDALVAVKIVNGVRHELDIMLGHPQDRLDQLTKKYESESRAAR